MIVSRLSRGAAAAFLFLVHCFAAAAPGPVEVTVDQFRSRAQQWFAQHEKDSTLDLFRDEAASAELRDLRLQLQQLLNQGALRADLADVGLKVREDGRGVTFELKRFPKWLPLEQAVTVLADPNAFRRLAAELRHQGLYEPNLLALQAYLSNNHLASRRLESQKILLSAYGRAIESNPAKSIELTRTFMSDTARQRYEIERSWTLALLDSLDARGQGAVAAFHDRQAQHTVFAMGADGEVSEIAARMADMLRSPQFQAQMRAQEAKFAKPELLDYSLESPIVAEEARDPSWSLPMQQKLEAFFSQHELSGRFHLVSVDCRTTYCELKAEGNHEEKTHEAFSQVAYEFSQKGWGLRRASGGGAPSPDASVYAMHERLERTDAR